MTDRATFTDEPAFPCEQHVDNDLLYTGMTVTDVFAGLAMFALMKNAQFSGLCSPRTVEEVAATAYQFGRAMVAEKNYKTQTKS